jgi:gamma-glutamyltranspeptidase
MALAEARFAEPPKPTDTSTTSVAVQLTQSTIPDPAVGASGMVSSANPYATRVGLKILSEGR